MNHAFNYEILHRCQFELLDFHNNPFGCGAAATHKVWWADDTKDAMIVCPEHFYLMYKKEVKDGS